MYSSWGTYVAEWTIKCDTRLDEQPPTADHFPIVTELDFPLMTNSTETPRNFRTTDWEEFKEVIDDEMAELEAPRELNNKEDLL